MRDVNKSRSVLLVCLLGIAWLTAFGCGPSAQESEYDRQQKALKDPFGYSADMDKCDMSVSGNGTFDKQGLKRDVDHVLNP